MTGHYLIEQVGEDFVKPPVELAEQDGNAFSIIGRVMRALKNAGREDLANEYKTRAMSGGSYENLVTLVYDYCDVDPDDDDESEM